MAREHDYSAELFIDSSEDECQSIAFGPWLSSCDKAVRWAEKQTGWNWANINMRRLDDHSVGDVIDSITP